MAIKKVAVLGAGNMGSGIAQACAQAGLTVYMRDIKPEFVQKGRERIEGPLRKRAAEGKMKPEDVDALMGRLHGTTDLKEAVQNADLVIEAVFEDLKVKQEVFAEASKYAPKDAIFATNTSSLSVTAMAAVTDRPAQFGGLHFFYPAMINKLVEVVDGKNTSPETLDALMAFSRRIGKVPIRTADAAGFAVNRFFVPWVNESVRLLEEGVADIPTIEAAAKEAFQIGMGPFELMNVTGVPISLHAETTLYQAFGEAYRPAKLLEQQVATKQNWDLSGTPNPAKFEAVKERLYGVAFGIATHLVDEGVCTRVDTDKGATIGLRWAKGPFEMMNALGIEKSAAAVRKYSDKWGKAFPMPRSLAAQEAAGKPWHLPKVRAEYLGNVAVVTIDRPEALNALNPDVLSDLRAAFQEVNQKPGVRAVVLTGEGQKAFVAGADIKFMSDKTPLEAREFTTLGQQIFRDIEMGKLPVIAAINGFAFGGGLELAMSCDILLASDNAVFGLPEVGLGIHPGFGGTQRAPRLLGVQRAKELVYTGRRFNAKEAQEMGLVLKVVPQDMLMEEALGMARAIAANGPVAVQLAKQAINRGVETDIETGLAYELEAVSLTFSTRDQKEAMKAFMEKRQATFEGK